jgi:hypothetical protein
MAIRSDPVSRPRQVDGRRHRECEHQESDAYQIALVEHDAAGQAGDSSGDERPATPREPGESEPDMATLVPSPVRRRLVAAGDQRAGGRRPRPGGPPPRDQ